VTTRLIRQEIVAEIDGEDNRVIGGTITLDSLAVPYGAAQIELPLTASSSLDDLDPRDDARIVIRAQDLEASPPVLRTFDLGIRSRTVDYITQTVSISCATDEALLDDYATLTEDSSAIPLQGSLRAVVNHVLAQVTGAALKPGDPDFDFTTFEDADQQLVNSGMRINVAGWRYSTGAGSFDATVRAPVVIPQEPEIKFGVAVYGLGAAAAGVGMYNWGGGQSGTGLVSVTPGDHLYGSAWILMSAAASVRFNWEFSDASGAGGSSIGGPAIAVPANTWTKVSSDVIVPAGKARLAVYCYTSTATPAGLGFTLAAPLVTKVRAGLPWFDGDVPDTPTYLYQWAGTPSQSKSTRTALIDRPPELLVWKPGVTAWEFLDPLMSAAGMRLYCDESRVWRMVVPADLEVPGVVRLSGSNAIAASDTITREDPDVFATGVVIRYVWNDETDTPRTAYDSAGTPDVVVVLDYARAYPGPGAAAAVLARRNGTGRTQDVDAATEWGTTPAQTASLTFPPAPEQQGKLSSVRFSLGDDAVMTIGTRGLIDIPPGSWFAWTPADQAWTAVADGVTWISLPA